MDKYTCRRCGYKGGQLHNIRTHYKRKKVCLAEYQDVTYEQLLNDLENGNHGDILVESKEIEYVNIKYIGKHKIIDKYLIESPPIQDMDVYTATEQQLQNINEQLNNHFIDQVDKAIKHLNPEKYHETGRDICIYYDEVSMSVCLVFLS